MIQFYYVIDVWVFWQQIVFNDFYYVVYYVCYIVDVGGDVEQVFGVYVVIGIVIVFKGVFFQWW